jgi:hypothetical protein
MLKQTYIKSCQGGEARGFDPGTSAPPNHYNNYNYQCATAMGRDREWHKSFKKCKDAGDFGGRIAHISQPPKTIFLLLFK